MRRFPFVVLLIACVSAVEAQSITPSSQQTVQIPIGAATIPGDIMYSLGQQNSQLVNISARLEKMEAKIAENQAETAKRMQELQDDVTTLNVYATIAAWAIAIVLTAMIGAFVTEQWRKRSAAKLAVANSDE